jgi:TonB family protein
VIALLAPGAAAQDLPALAERDGFAAVHDAVVATTASEKPKKLAEALAAAGLGRLSMPVTAALGADLVITRAGPLGGCTPAGTGVTCEIPLATAAAVREGEYALTCTSRLGASLLVASTLRPGATADHAVLAVTDVLPCWKLGGDALRLAPVAGAELEGVGQGNDLVPPELVGLSKRQVEATIQEHAGAFRHCLVAEGRPGLTGKVVVAFHIAADGRMDEVSVESSTLGDAAVEGCVVARFRALTFPRPNDGYDRGTWPVTFQ